MSRLSANKKVGDLRGIHPVRQDAIVQRIADYVVSLRKGPFITIEAKKFMAHCAGLAMTPEEGFLIGTIIQRLFNDLRELKKKNGGAAVVEAESFLKNFK